MDHLNNTAIKTKGKHLNYEKRIKIEALYKAGLKSEEIARQIGCSGRTIRREPKRGMVELLNSDLRTRMEYSADAGQQKHEYAGTGLEFKFRLINSGYVIEIENAKFWFDKLDTIYQISVFGDFNGKLFNCIGVNSSLEDVLNHIGNYEYEPYCYTLPNYPGVCFELEDVDNWNELKTPIEFISVFKIK